MRLVREQSTKAIWGARFTHGQGRSVDRKVDETGR